MEVQNRCPIKHSLVVTLLMHYLQLNYINIGVTLTANGLNNSIVPHQHLRKA